MFYKRVFMSVFDWMSFCFRQHSLGHKIQEFRYSYFVSFLTFMSYLTLWDENGTAVVSERLKRVQLFVEEKAV